MLRQTMKTFCISRCFAAVFFATLAYAPPPVQATLRVWSGSASMDNSWTNHLNWSGNVAPVAGDDLQFPFDATKPNSSDNFTNGTTFNSIQFWHGGTPSPNRSYDLGGSSIALNAGVSAVNNYPSGWANTVNNALLLNSNQTFTTGPFTSLTLAGAIALNGKTLTFDTASFAPIDVQALISGTGGLVKTNVGTLTVYSNNTYTGSTTLSGGTLQLLHGGSASPIVLVAGTLYGSGTVGTITSTGNGSPGTIVLSPIASAATLICSNVALNAATTFQRT
jgi:autotransporter-associated beta strand protein